MKPLFPALLIAMAGTAAFAGGSYDASGKSVGTSSHTYIPMGETHIYVDMNSSFTLEDNGTPLGGNTGDCIGYMEIAVGQGANGKGMCTWSDADGDTWFGPWTVSGMSPDRASLGTWFISGGTGKFAGATGGGNFVSLTDPASGATSLDVTGSVTLK